MKTMEELLEAVFSVRPMPKLYDKDQLPLQESPWTAVEWPPACEDVSPDADDRPLLEHVTKQGSEDDD
jgi:hypothetical protein